MQDFLICDGVLKKYDGPGGAVAVPDGVTTLATSFFMCRNVTSVYLPETVEIIEPAAFYLCENMTSVHLPRSLREIGTTAFLGCKSLTHVTVPGSVQTITTRTFLGCGLQSLTLEEGVSTLEAGAFRNCESLQEIILPASVTTVGAGAFYGCTDLRRAVLHGTLRRLGAAAFAECEALEELIAPGLRLSTVRSEQLAAVAAVGYLCSPEMYQVDEVAAQYQKFITDHRNTLVCRLVKQDRVEGLQTYARLGKINARNFESDFLIPAQEANAPACVAFLLDWKNKHSRTKSRGNEWKL